MEELTAKMASEIAHVAYKRRQEEEQARLAEQAKKDEECLSQPHVQEEIQNIFNLIKSASDNGRFRLDCTANPQEEKISMDEYATIGRYLERLGYRVKIRESLISPNEVDFEIEWVWSLMK